MTPDDMLGGPLVRAVGAVLGVVIFLGISSIVWVPCVAVLDWFCYALGMACR